MCQLKKPVWRSAMQRWIGLALALCCGLFANQSFAMSHTLHETTLTLKKQTARYQIEANSPQFDGLDLALNQAIAAAMQLQRQHFVAEVGTPINQRPSTLTVNYKIVDYQADSFISLLFSNNTFLSGAAHPDQRSFVINYDLKQHRLLQLSDLFAVNSDYLTRLQQYCFNDLSKRQLMTQQFVKEGTAAQVKNYQQWNLTKKGLLITFDPAQVAPYANGTLQVLVPFSALPKTIFS